MPFKKRSSEAVAGNSDVEQMTPAKKARNNSGSASASALATGQPVKKGRGRPRKYPPAPPKETSGPKRGRGRPRKNPVPGTADGPAEKHPPSSSSTAKASGRAPARVPGRGRGRPRKTPAASTSAPASDVPVEGASDEEPVAISYWLMKAEPESRMHNGVDVKFSIDDLRAASEPEAWDGVRNSVAQKNMRLMKKGDLAFFYHSNCKSPGIVGTMEIVQEHSVDKSAFDPKHPYYDEKSSPENPRWEVVHVKFRSKFKNLISLEDLKSRAQPGGPLENLQTLKQSRLSVSAVTPSQWKFIMSLAEEEDNDEEAEEEEEGDEDEEEADEEDEGGEEEEDGDDEEEEDEED